MTKRVIVALSFILFACNSDTEIIPIADSTEEKNGDSNMNRSRFPMPRFMDENLPPGTPPAVRKSWSVTGELTCLNTDIQRSMQVDFVEPGSYTVQFNKQPIDPQPNPLIPVPIESEATIQWKVAGNIQQRIISLNDGVSISGNADGVIVTMRDTSQDASLVGVRYQVTATVNKGVRPYGNNPPVLYRPNGVFSVLGGAILTRPVPQNAGITSVQVLIGSNSGGVFPPIPDNNVQVIQQAGVNLMKIYDPRYFDWVTLAPGATDVVISNHGAGDIFVAVAWGVDG